MTEVQLWAGAVMGLLTRHRVQTDSGAHSASYPMGAVGFYSGAWNYISTHPIRFHDVVLS
jgi:hypothetical protein